MSHTLSADALREATTRTLEDAAFMFCEPADDDVDPWPPTVVSGQVMFHGPLTGYLRMQATQEFAEELAANLLAVERDSPDARASAPAALSELLNIVGGAVVADWFGTDQPTQLGIPSAGEAAFSQAAGACCVVSLLAEGHRLRIEVLLE